MTRAEIIERAVALIGTRFHRQGRSLEGVSCDGVLAYAGGIAGTPADERWPEGKQITKGKIREALLRAGFVEVEGPPRPGHALLFRRPFSEVEEHVAVVVDDERMVHAREDPGRACRTRLDETWRSLLSGVFEFPGVTDGT